MNSKLILSPGQRVALPGGRLATIVRCDGREIDLVTDDLRFRVCDGETVRRGLQCQIPARGWNELSAIVQAAEQRAKVDQATRRSEAENRNADLVRVAAEFPHLVRVGARDWIGARYVSENIRRELRRCFQDSRFSVNVGWKRIVVAWDDGPTTDQVSVITKRHQERGSAFAEMFGNVAHIHLDRTETKQGKRLAWIASGRALEDVDNPAWCNLVHEYWQSTDLRHDAIVAKIRAL